MNYLLAVIFLFISSLGFCQSSFIDGSRTGGTSNNMLVTSSGVITFTGLGGIDCHYASFSSSSTQTISATTQVFDITYDTAEVNSGFTFNNFESSITVNTAGVYLITYSAVAETDAPNKLLEIWLVVDGVDVPRSNTVTHFVGTGNEKVITVTYIYKFTAGQIVKLAMWSDDIGTELLATAAESGPPSRPACPSIILTINMISKD